jgi:hypothetical protein
MVRSAAALRVSNHRPPCSLSFETPPNSAAPQDEGDYLNFPRAATGSTPTMSSPRTITTSSIMLTTTQT